MKHRSDYRIVRTQKQGYYTYYRVQERFLLFFWNDCSCAFDDIQSAEYWIADQLICETKEVIK